MKRHPINVRIPADLLERMPPPSQEAPHVAEQNGTGRGAWIVQAIREKLERDEGSAP